MVWVNRVRRRVRLFALFSLLIAVTAIATAGLVTERETGTHDPYSL